MKRKAFCIAAMIAAAAAINAPLQAAEILLNGGFESGLSGWQRADQLGGDGTFALQTGLLSPVNGDSVPGAPQGTNSAMSDGGGPGSHILWQDFTILGVTTQTILSFDLFIGNRAQVFATPNPPTLDFSINAPNQQVRVDVLSVTADPFSLTAPLLNVYQSNPGNALVTGYVPVSFDITSFVNANLGQFRLRFSEVDNLAELQLGVDAVSVNATSTAGTIPEPSTLLLAGVLLAGMLIRSVQRELTTVRRRSSVGSLP